MRRSLPAGRALPAAASYDRGPLSDRQLLPAVRSARREHATASGRLHPSAEAVLFCAVALLGLIGLLHRASVETSPLGLEVENTSKGTKTRLAPVGASARLRAADYMDCANRVSNVKGVPLHAPATVVNTPREYPNQPSPKPCSLGEPGAILRRPAAPHTPTGGRETNAEEGSSVPSQGWWNHRPRGSGGAEKAPLEW